MSWPTFISWAAGDSLICFFSLATHHKGGCGSKCVVATSAWNARLMRG
jgi:hypothetical protein